MSYTGSVKVNPGKWIPEVCMVNTWNENTNKTESYLLMFIKLI